MVINTWVTQCCCILYCTVYSIHTRETRYTRTRKYTTHSLVSQNARIIFAVFLGAIADGAFREWPLSTDHTRDLCEIAAPRRCPLQIPAEIFADGGLCLWPRPRSTDGKTQVLARFPELQPFLYRNPGESGKRAATRKLCMHAGDVGPKQRQDQCIPPRLGGGDGSPQRAHRRPKCA